MLKYLVKCMADCIITVTDLKKLLHQNQTSDFSTKHDTKREGSTLLQGEISMVWIVQYLIFFCFRKWCWKATWWINRGRTVTVGRSALIDFILPYCFTFCVCVWNIDWMCFYGHVLEKWIKIFQTYIWFNTMKCSTFSWSLLYAQLLSEWMCRWWLIWYKALHPFVTLLCIWVEYIMSSCPIRKDIMIIKEKPLI